MGGQQQVHSVDHAHSFGAKQGHCPVDSCIFVHQLGSAPALLARTPAQGWRSRAEQLGPESTARFAAERVLCRPRLPGAHGARVVLAQLLFSWRRFFPKAVAAPLAAQAALDVQLAPDVIPNQLDAQLASAQGPKFSSVSSCASIAAGHNSRTFPAGRPDPPTPSPAQS